MPHVTRRQFGKTAAAAWVATAAGSTRVLGASDRVRLGFIGLGNRGDQVLDAFLAHKDAEIVGLCDIHAPYVDFAARKAGGQPARHKDYRALLDMKDVDAVVINTPDHWHALQMIQACEAGKDVYVEKPLSLVVSEGRAMVSAARRHQRVVQVGIHRRSAAFVKEAADLVRNGAVGQITVARAFHVQNEWPRGIGAPPDEPPPAGFDWDAWVGPAPMRPYNKNRTFYRFRWFYDYSGGQVTNFGVHYLDAIHWALGHDAPRSVTAMGGKVAIDDNREIPDTLEVLWTYPGGTLVTFSQYNATAAPAAKDRRVEIEFRGTKGTLYLYGDGYEIVPDVITPNEFPARTPVDRTIERGYRTGAKAQIEPLARGGGSADTSHHARNFLDCVKTREACACDIALKTKTYLEWDREAERFTNSEKANALLTYKYRAPYRL
jgi:predicted dehydrogenase